MDKKKELEVVSLMIGRYCHGHHRTKGRALCEECAALLEYVKFRRDKCPHGDDKPFCSNCKIHCYRPEMREKIRAVMRYSGPRIVFRHPLLATRHLVESKREKKRMERAAKEEQSR